MDLDAVHGEAHEAVRSEVEPRGRRGLLRPGLLQLADHVQLPGPGQARRLRVPPPKSKMERREVSSNPVTG